MHKIAKKAGGFIPYRLKGFTFGFEIEGEFRDDITEILKPGGRFKQDGSVEDLDNLPDDRRLKWLRNPINILGLKYSTAFKRLPDDVMMDLSEGYLLPEQAKKVCKLHNVDYEDYLNNVMEFGQTSHIEEYNSPVFTSVEDMLEEIKKFKSPYYYYNDTCGVHLHIGCDDRSVLHNLFGTRAMVEQLEQAVMPLMCGCVQERVNDDDSWCEVHPEGDFVDERISYDRDKYRAFNLHYQGTIECRLFAPCSHLLKNMQIVLTELFRIGSRELSTTPKPIVCTFPEQLEKVEVIEVAKIDKKKRFEFGFNRYGLFDDPVKVVADGWGVPFVDYAVDSNLENIYRTALRRLNNRE